MDANDGVIIDLLTTAATALITAYITFWVNWKKARADLENEFQRRFNDKKWEVYTEFTKFLRHYSNRNFGDSGNDSDDELGLLASQILLAGSDKVVRAFQLWRESARVHGNSDETAREKLFHLVLEMRKDLGNRQTRLESDVLWKALSLASDE
jgi:hypothetical protein